MLVTIYHSASNKDQTVSKANTARYLYLRYLSKPQRERTLFGWIARNRPKLIVELGLNDGVRASRIIEVANRYAKTKIIYYGIDQFEADGQARLPLRVAHKRLAKSGASIRLVPGDPSSAMTGLANEMSNVDMYICNFSVDDPSMATAWFYVPRTLGESTGFFAIDHLTERYTALSHGQIKSLAAKTPRERRAA